MIPHLTACLNGRFAPLSELQVSVMDRGFLFGDGVYELIPVYGRRPFRMAEHLRRLANSLAAVELANPYTAEEWGALIEKLIAAQDFADQSVYLQVTRGPAWPRNHAFPAETSPTVFLYAEPLIPPAASAIENGVAAISSADIRWLRCNVKACSLIANVLLKQQASAAGVAEVVLFRDGILIEGSASNIFAVKDGVILVPPASHLMLTGITYDVILEIVREHGLPHQIREIVETEIHHLDELWLSSSSREVQAIVTLDGRPVGNGCPGPMYQTIYPLYQRFKATQMRSGT